MLYRCLATGLNKRQLIKYDENYHQIVSQMIANAPKQDFYESIYLYEEKHKELFDKSNSLSGITDVKTDRVVFDFDSKSNVEQAQKDAIKVVTRLTKSGISDSAIRIFWSGNKGFHVETHLNNQMINRSQFEKYINYFAGDLDTFDHKVKDEQRIFRVPMSRHQSSGMLKIPISIDQLENNTILELQDLAKGKYDASGAQWDNVDLEPFETAVKSIELEKVTEKVMEIKQFDGPDMINKPKHMSAAKYVLQEGYFEDGERNEACMILAATYRYFGYNKDVAYNILKATLRLRASRLGLSGYDKDELWHTVINPVYSPTWKGGTFSEEEGLLKKVIQRFNLEKTPVGDNLISLDKVSKAFEDFAVNIDSNTVKMGISEIDDKVRITTSMLVSFLAAPGAGKTSYAMGMLNDLSNRGEKSIFFSLDMGFPQVFQRLLQKHTGDSDDIILMHYKNKNNSKINEYRNKLAQEYKNVKFCFKGGLTCDMIRQYLVDERDSTGKLPKLIVVDYLECVKTAFSDSTQSKAFVGSTLKDIANEFGICVFLLVQPTKNHDPSTELNSYMNIKGSGVIAEASTVVMTLSRPGFSPKNNSNDKFACLTVVKNRMGQLSSTDLHWEGLTGHVRSLTDEEENDLKEIRAKLASQEAAESNKYGF